MRFDSLFRVLFILYCVEAGVFLLIAPWTPFWDRGVLQLALATLRAVCLTPAVRAAASGFGLVHLSFAVHDVDDWLRIRRARARLGPSTGG